MITGRADLNPNLARLNRMGNPLHGCSPNPSIIYKYGASVSLKKPTFLGEQPHLTDPI
jgi:hypothetical protein